MPLFHAGRAEARCTLGVGGRLQTEPGPTNMKVTSGFDGFDEAY